MVHEVTTSKSNNEIIRAYGLGVSFLPATQLQSINKALLFEKFLKAHSGLSLTVLKFLIVLLFHEVGT